MPENNPINQKNDEIDLLDLFKRIGRSIGRFLNSIGRGCLVSIVFLLKNWLPLGLSLIAGVGISFISKSVFPPVYKGDLVVRTNTLPVGEMISYVNKLHVYCDEENFQSLATSLSMPLDKVSNIVDVNAYWIVDNNKDNIPDYVDYSNSFNVYDTTNTRMPDRLDICIKSRTSGDLLPIKSGILRFINNDSLFNQRNRLRLQQNAELLTRLGYDIRQLDSLQKVKYFEETRNRIPNSSGQIVFMQEQKTQLVYTDIYDLYTRKQAIDEQQTLYKDIVTIIRDITIPVKPITRTLYYGEVVIPVCFGLTLLILILRKNRKGLKEIFQSY
jgi:hypothetical protein